MSERLCSALRKKVNDIETQLPALFEAKMLAISGTWDRGDVETAGASDDKRRTPFSSWVDILPVPERCVAFHLSLDNSEPSQGVSLKLME